METFSVIKKNLFGHKTLFDRNGLEKKIAGLRPAIFFSRKNFGAASVSPCEGRNFGENLRRRVLAEILARERYSNSTKNFKWPNTREDTLSQSGCAVRV